MLSVETGKFIMNVDSQLYVSHCTHLSNLLYVLGHFDHWYYACNFKSLLRKNWICWIYLVYKRLFPSFVACIGLWAGFQVVPYIK